MSKPTAPSSTCQPVPGTGVVSALFPERSFGFIFNSQTCKSLWFAYGAISDRQIPDVGTRVSFQAITAKDGRPRAIDIRTLPAEMPALRGDAIDESRGNR
jgi:hypothetical protein